MRNTVWRSVVYSYLAYVLVFPLAMAWVETRSLDGPTICAFRQVTRLDCPGCGLTRAFKAMGRLDVAGAFRYNPLGPAIFVVACLYWVYAVAQLYTRGRVQLPLWWKKAQLVVLWCGIVLYLVCGIGRMVYEIHHPPPPPLPWKLPIRWPI